MREIDLTCQVCKQTTLDYYMVYKRIWRAAGLKHGLCCLRCLAQRLGRPLRISDFDPDLPINDLLFVGYRMGLRARR